MTWKVSLPCTRDEAELAEAEAELFADIEPMPVLVTSEETAERWQLDAFFERKPDRAAIDRLLALAPSAGGRRPRPEQVPEHDWVTLSQQGLEPVHAGRFFVHTPAFRGAVPAGAVPFRIEAGLAFGTGQHETTAGCLVALDRLKRQGFRARNFADVGTGTGLLAFAALHLWPMARGVASDIDPIAVAVTRENAGINRVPLGRGTGRLDTVTAAGLEHPRLDRQAPYDLVIANILAGPLVELAPSIGPAVAPGGRLILAGLLESQAARVAAAYQREGLRMLFSVWRGEWPTLVLRRPRA
ncbi:MAG TPA: 50S ribosomal protein L11 methyltransferase [Allosphingosinicella sp.]|jgi:ribosomal protein L11 methyltransferase